jgi:hypothetical protein
LGLGGVRSLNELVEIVAVSTPAEDAIFGGSWDWRRRKSCIDGSLEHVIARSASSAVVKAIFPRILDFAEILVLF